MTEGDLVAAAVLTGNRNFEGRVNPLVKANYLASPPLVVAYALAGTTDIDLATEPLGTGTDGQPVYLERHLADAARRCGGRWPRACSPEMFRPATATSASPTTAGTPCPIDRRRALRLGRHEHLHPGAAVPGRDQPRAAGLRPSVRAARVLLALGDSVTTDHISPAGSIAKTSPAGTYLVEHGVAPVDFNSYGARRGNDRVMTRGTFANIRIRNLLAPGTEGGVTRHLPDGEVMPIYDAAMKYREQGTPLVVLAGSEYGTGSSRDWAAKGTHAPGRAGRARRQLRADPPQQPGRHGRPAAGAARRRWQSLGLTGEETFDIPFEQPRPPGHDHRTGHRPGRRESKEIPCLGADRHAGGARPVQAGGILPFVLRRLLAE